MPENGGQPRTEYQDYSGCVAQDSGDTGYVYGGGWSTSGNDSVDAGLIYSAARGVTNLFYADHFNYGNGVIGGGSYYNSQVDYAPNTDLEVDFIIGNSGCSQSCVGDPNALTDFVWGTYAYGGGFGGTTLGFRPNNLSDWEGSQTVLKAMVSIGQTPIHSRTERVRRS